MRLSGWRPALRIARREARRHRGRTALVAILVALPVLVGVFVGVAARTAQLPAEEEVRRLMGTADAYLIVTPCTELPEFAYSGRRPYNAFGCQPLTSEAAARQDRDLAALLPDGAQWFRAPAVVGATRLAHGVSGWRPALRIAWREARRHRGRTALVAIMVALPVLVGAFFDVVLRTNQLPAAQLVQRYMGSTADAYLHVSDCPSISGLTYFEHHPSPESGCEQPRADRVELGDLLPAGSSWIAGMNWVAYQVRLIHGDRSQQLQAMELDTSSALSIGLLHLRAGRLPQRSGEVALTVEAARALRAGPGDVLSSKQSGRVTVVGTVIEPDCLLCTAAYGLPGWAGPRNEDMAPTGIGSYLVDLPDSVDPMVLQGQLLDQGVLLAPRAQAIDPPPNPDDSSTVDPAGIAVGALIVGFGLIEVCLLAGAAFAVGARRQVRDLGLVAAAGGEARHVRRIVLAQGVVTGLVGSLAALPLVVGLVFVGRPWIERVNGRLMGPLDVRPFELLPLVAVGVLAGLAAAMVPAYTAARLPVLDALNRRFKATSLAARWPRVGVALFAAGAGLAAFGSWRWFEANAENRRAVMAYLASDIAGEGAGGYAPPTSTRYVGLLLVAFAMAALGLALLAPTLVASIARLARRLPLSARLGLRDAGRHRHRTGPAVAAIMAAVAGSVAMAFYTVGDRAHQDRSYHWSMPEGWTKGMVVQGDQDVTGSAADEIERAARDTLPVREVIRTSYAGPPAPVGSEAYEQGLRQWQVFPTQARSCDDPTGFRGGDVAVADPATVRMVFGELPAEVSHALAAGTAVATHCQVFADGRVQLSHGGLYEFTHNEGDLVEDPDPILVPAIYAPRAEYLELPAILLPEAVLDRLGWDPIPGRVVIQTTRTPTKDEEQAFSDTLADAFPDAYVGVVVERGYQPENALLLLVLAGGCGFVTLVGTAIAVALAGAEGRSDHATLLAVGAEPRRRRLLAMAQAGTVSLLGVGLGALLGGMVAVAMLGADLDRPVIVPWTVLAQIVIGIPLLGVVIAGLFTRSRLPMVRRFE